MLNKDRKNELLRKSIENDIIKNKRRKKLKIIFSFLRKKVLQKTKEFQLKKINQI